MAVSALATRSMGRRVPMSPVDMARTRSGCVPTWVARVAARLRWSARPASPVAALAQPEVDIMASTQP